MPVAADEVGEEEEEEDGDDGVADAGAGLGGGMLVWEGGFGEFGLERAYV